MEVCFICRKPLADTEEVSFVSKTGKVIRLCKNCSKGLKGKENGKS